MDTNTHEKTATPEELESIRLLIDGFRKTLALPMSREYYRQSTPQEMVLKCLESLLKEVSTEEKNSDRTLSAIVVVTVLHYSLEGVTWDQFLSELEPALKISIPMYGRGLNSQILK
jgi:hypothetical protein